MQELYQEKTPFETMLKARFFSMFGIDDFSSVTPEDLDLQVFIRHYARDKDFLFAFLIDS